MQFTLMPAAYKVLFNVGLFSSGITVLKLDKMPVYVRLCVCKINKTERRIEWCTTYDSLSATDSFQLSFTLKVSFAFYSFLGFFLFLLPSPGGQQ